MKIKLSRSQWEKIGLKTGWIKTAKENFEQFLIRMENQGIEVPDFIIEGIRNAKFKNADFSNINDIDDIVHLLQTTIVPKGAMRRKLENSLAFKKRQINNDLADFTKNNYFDGIPISSIRDIVEKHGLKMVSEDGTSFEAIFCGREGKTTIDLARPEDMIVRPNETLPRADIDKFVNSMIVMTWYKMPSGRYEIVCYMS